MDQDYTMRFPPACDAQIAALGRLTDQSPPEVVRTLALMGLHMWAQMNGRPDVVAECVAELGKSAKAAGRPLAATPLIPL